MKGPNRAEEVRLKSKPNIYSFIEKREEAGVHITVWHNFRKA